MDVINPSVSVLIVSYNTHQLTLDCVNSVMSQKGWDDQEIILVDNNSSDGSADGVAQRFPEIKLIRSLENLGFARANNLAAQHASGDYILLLNPDTVVLDDAISSLVSFARKNPTAKLWGGRTIYSDGTLNPFTCWRFLSIWSIAAGAFGLSSLFPGSDIFNREGYGSWKRDTVRKVEIVVGCFFLIERQLWQKLGGFDERFFMYAEEADLCFRSKQEGAQPLFTPSATIIHYDGASEPQVAPKIIRLFRGKATFIIKHWPRWKYRVGIQLMKIHVIIRVVACSLSWSLFGNKKHKAAAHDWLTVWSERRSWEKGYPPI